jgi:hypothetical protein
MQWLAPNQPVTFKQYNGAFTLATLPGTPADNQWTTSANQNPFIPASDCQNFHLNFWMGDFSQAVNGIKSSARQSAGNNSRTFNTSRSHGACSETNATGRAIGLIRPE